jgi:ornithine carbamoyltransferase
MNPNGLRHFVDLTDISREELRGMVESSLAMKVARKKSRTGEKKPLAGQMLAMIFDKPSTRTRVSFDVAMRQLGGETIVLTGPEMQLGRGETIADTARVLSGYLHGIVIRSSSDETLAEFAGAAAIPVINGLTPLHHPCQALADLLTLRERFGELDGLTVAYVGDGNNVARSLAIAGRLAGVEVRVATPPGYELEPGLAALDTNDPREAAAGADALYTDVWVSMGERDAERKRADLGPYQLNEELLGLAAERAIALHCLPAHPGEEITAGALYGPRSAVWDQAENRLHAQKALLELLIQRRREPKARTPGRP